MTVATALNHATDTNQIANCVTDAARPNLRNPTDDLVAGYAWVDSVRPLVFDLMNIRVADASVEHVYLNFVRARFFALKLDALQATVRVLCGITQGFDHGISSQLIGDFKHSYLFKRNSTLQKYSLQPYFGWSTTQLD